MSRYKDLTDERFGRLTVSHLDQISDGRAVWVCKCDCGNTKSVLATNLKSGGILSCGCLHRENSSKRMARQSRTHGMSYTGTYDSWRAMKDRCCNNKNHQYHLYGARGIKVCKRWMLFEYFYEDMGERPKGMTIDRWPNNDGNYEPSNCRWATPKEQANNRNECEGERVHSSKLTEDDVIYIRQSKLSRFQLARVYEVDESTIRCVLNRKTWKHVK